VFDAISGCRAGIFSRFARKEEIYVATVMRGADDDRRRIAYAPLKMSFARSPRDAKLSLLHYQAHVASEYSPGVNRDTTVAIVTRPLFDNLCPPRTRGFRLRRSTMCTYDELSRYQIRHCAPVSSIAESRSINRANA